MKLDQTYVNTPWKKAIQMILDDSSSSKPVLLVRQDDLHHGHMIWQHMRTKYKCVYVRMGIICSMAHLYEEILSQLHSGHTTVSNGNHESTIQTILAALKKLEQSILIVIDNCHHLVLAQIFYLLGLIVETEGRARFLFFITNEQLKPWSKKFSMKDPRGRFFFKIVERKYELSY